MRRSGDINACVAVRCQLESAGEGGEAGSGEEAVDDAVEKGEFVVVEFGDGGEAVAEGVIDGREGAVGGCRR